MKIAMIGHKRIPSREGGVEIVVEKLAERMVAQGHEVYAYNRKGHHVSGKENDVKAVKEYKGIHIITVPTFEKKSLNAFVYSVLATIHALFQHYDVIHYHASGSCAMLWLPRLFGIHTVATIHGLDSQRSKWGGFASRYLQFGERMAAKYADELIVLSEGNRKYFKDMYGRNATLIPNGVEKPELKEAKLILERYGLKKKSYILFLARIVPEKGLHYLIPVLAFVCGVFVAEQVHMRYKNMKRVHWRQLVVLAEVILLFSVGLMPESANMAANALTSFACAMQVQTFRKVNGYTIASTMCIGNIRSEIESLSAYLKTHNHKLLDQTYRYLGIILIFALGAGTGFKLAESLAYHTIWVCCLLLMVSFVLMLIPADEFVLPKDIPEGDYLYGGRK